MPTDEEIGKKIVEAVWMNEKHSNIFFTSLQKQLNKLNTKTTKEATKLYDKILSSLDLKDKLVENSVDNLSKVSKLMLGIDKIQRVYRKEYGKIIKIARKGNQELLKDREERITKLLNKVDIVEKSRTLITKENKTLLEMLNQQGYKRINQTLEKWKNFAYDMFYVGVTRGMVIEEFKSLFYTDVGTLKIGSALAQEVEMETMISVTEQRTAFLQQRAKELGYKYCWNSNPMDMRTKPECIGACLSGVITEAEMGSTHGFPPRFLCRCELVYTRGEWAGVNRGVNGAIADRRLHLLDELKSTPNQMSAWMRLGKEVHVDADKYPLRAAGMKPYKDIEDKIKLIESTKVPEFEFEEIKWKPVMTKKEADEWAKNSVKRETFYHGTSKKKGLVIAKSGFKLRIETVGGKVLGDGVYLTPSKHVAEMYTKGEILNLRVDVKKVYELKSYKEIVQLSQKAEKAGFPWGADQLPNYLQSLGYDAISGLKNLGEEMGMNVFNPKNVVNIK